MANTEVVPTRYGFNWNLEDGSSPVVIERLTAVQRTNGAYRCLGITSDKQRLEIYVTPKGSFRVYKGGKELK